MVPVAVLRVDEAEAAEVGDLHGTVPVGGQGGRHGLGCLRHAGGGVSEEEGLRERAKPGEQNQIKSAQK